MDVYSIPEYWVFVHMSYYPEGGANDFAGIGHDEAALEKLVIAAIKARRMSYDVEWSVLVVYEGKPTGVIHRGKCRVDENYAISNPVRLPDSKVGG